MSDTCFDFLTTPLQGLVIVQRKSIEDRRGFFSRFYCADEFRVVGFNSPIAQINHSLTVRKGAVRGLHFQHLPYAETKIVSCIKGKVFDVAVDVRQDSPTFLQWHGEILSAGNDKSLLIPDGFAHGFQALIENCELIYLHTTPYKTDAEGALNVQDPRIAVEWPLDIAELSDRDRSHPFVKLDFKGIRL